MSKISSRRVLREYVRTDHCASRYFKEQPSFIFYIPQAIFRAVRLWDHGDHDGLTWVGTEDLRFYLFYAHVKFPVIG